MSRLAPSPERGRTRDDRKHLLVVEDEASIREVVAAWLRDEGFTVTTAANGAEAIEQLRVVRPDAIVLDLMMPIMDGRTFVERCRAESLCADIPIVVVSASHNLRSAASRLTAKGVSAVITRPFSLEVLIGAIDRLLQPSST